MYRGIIFDMDGVLADTESYYTNRRDEYLRLMGYQRQENTDFTGSNEKALWETMVPNDPELRQELLMGYRAYRKLHPIPFRELLDPQAAALFRTLKERGQKIGIASSSDPKAIAALVQAAGVEALVDSQISGDQCKAHKPDPEIYLRSLKALGLTAGEALAVEDSPTGILSAKRAGLTVLALRPRHDEPLDQSAADTVISQLMDVVSYIQNEKERA
ncbi:HAD family phosphatase [Oscillospiraceae bacterium 44-34]